MHVAPCSEQKTTAEGVNHAEIASKDGVHRRTGTEAGVLDTITAGSGFATTELKLLLLDLALDLEAHWAGMIVFKLYVEDMTLAACGAPQWVISLLCQVTNFVIQWLEEKLRMLVSSSKSKAVADSIKIAVAIAST